MAEGDFKISQMTELPFNTDCEFIADDPDGGDYATNTHTISEISTTLLNSFQYTQDLDTTDKKIVGAVAELGLADGLGYIGRNHIQAGNAFAWVKDIFREPNVEIEIYSNNTTGIRQIVINDNMLIVYFADSSFDYDVEAIARHGLV